jgi:hypothetical protein
MGERSKIAFADLPPPCSRAMNLRFAPNQTSVIAMRVGGTGKVF